MAARSVKPEYAYLKLRCDPATEDPITWKLMISVALSKFGGIHGSAIQTDILNISAGDSPEYSQAIVRVPASSVEFVSAGVSGATEDNCSIRVQQVSNWLPMLL